MTVLWLNIKDFQMPLCFEGNEIVLMLVTGSGMLYQKPVVKASGFFRLGLKLPYLSQTDQAQMI